MAMGTRKKRERQEDLWVVSSEIVGTPAHAFYDRLNEILDQHHFDRNVEHLCRRYYKGPLGRPSITPGVYFRTLLLGYFEGIDSERGIAWRLADSLSMRRFIAYALTEATAWPWEPGRSVSGRKICGSSAARSWAPRRMPFMTA